MGEVTIDALVAALRASNPETPVTSLVVYADALRQYHEASENIRRLGSVVEHPRTGAPFENPYLKVQTQTGRTVSRMHWIDGKAALALLEAKAKAPADPAPVSKRGRGGAPGGRRR